MNKPLLIAIGVIVLIVIAIPLLGGLGKDGDSETEAPSQPATKPEIDIWTAVSQGAVGIVKQHIAFGTDVNSTFSIQGVPGTGGTPLHIACLSSNTEMIRVLIDNGANKEQKAVYPDPGGGTPLHWAIFALNPISVKAMLDAGANVNSIDKNGATPLDYAIVDFATLVPMDPATFPPNRRQIYDMLAKKGARHQ